jgi:hypothetical protein
VRGGGVEGGEVSETRFTVCALGSTPGIYFGFPFGRDCL